MSARLIHGYVQMWSMELGMSQSKEAFIGTVGGEENVKLLLYFSIGKVTTLQLNNNIKSVALRSYGENQNHLYLTFHNNDFLFIERLSSTDAEQLKTILDKVHQNDLQQHMTPDKGEGVSTSIDTQKMLRKTSLYKICEQASNECLEIAKESKTSLRPKMPLFTSRSSTFISKELENQHGKRKRILLSDSERNDNESVLKENNFEGNKTSKANPLTCISHNYEKQLKLRELQENKKLAFEFSFMTNISGNPYLDDPQTFTEKIALPFLLDPNCSEDSPEWNELKMSLALYPEKLLQGLPNLGNTCYMNAVIQSLCSVPSFVNDLLNQNLPWIKIPRDAFSICLAQLLVLKDAYNMSMKEQLLVHIKRATSLIAKIFAGDRQNDAHEFLSLCLEQMKETIQKLNTILETSSKCGEENSPEEASAGNAPTKMAVCPVITNFEFELLSSILCKACGRAVLKTELSNYLSINLPQQMKAYPSSIQSSFDHFFGIEELEYKCGQCKHDRSVVVHKFSRLPRVLIIHLKRYSYDEFWSLMKDEREVSISTYLKLSSHCNKSSKPPVPLRKDSHIKDFQFLKAFQKMSFEIINSSTFSTKRTSECEDSVALHIASNKELEPQKFQSFFNPNYEKTDILEGLDFGRIRETNKAFNEDKSPRNVERLQKVAIPTQKFDEIRKHTQPPQQARPCSLPKPDAQEHTQSLRRPTELSLQKGNLNYLGSLYSNKNPENKYISDKKSESEAKEPQRNNNKRDPYTYRLIGIISHLGDTPHSGHFISDAYDFRRHVWFTYNDLQVSNIEEAQMQDARINSGYVLFYMHNEIFEELLARGEKTNLQSTKEKKTSQEE